MANIMQIGELSLVKGQLSHIMRVAENMRMEDEFECSLFDVSPLEALLLPFAVNSKTTYTLMANNKPIALMGTVKTDMPKIGRVWFLATNELYEHQVSFLKGTKDVVDLLQGDYSMIENFIPIECDNTRKWLEWAGFVFDNEIYYLNNYKFHKFIRCNLNKNMSYNEMSQPIYH